MPAPRTTTAAILLAAACGTTEDVTIRVLDRDGDCTAAVFDAVDTLSLEVIATAGRCRLKHACPPYVPVRSVADVEAALRYSDVLLELDPDEAQLLVLNGRPKHNCFPLRNERGEIVDDNSPVMCAYASLGHGPGTIELDLVADIEGEDTCPESIQECP